MMMLEDAALRLVTSDEQTLTGVGFLLLLVGFVLALIFHRGQRSKMQRATYFAYSALLYVVGALLPIAWLFALQAMAAGILWVLVAGVFGTIAVLGFCYGDIDLARSRDAYGNNRSAFLAIIPVANLVLLLKPSKNASVNKLTLPLFSGGLGVVSGFVLLIFGAVATTLLNERLAKQADTIAPADSIDFLLRTRGLEGTLAAMAREAQLPVAVDSITTLSRIDADGQILRRIFTVKTDVPSLSADFGARVIQTVCQIEAFAPPLRAGATIEEVYLNEVGNEIGRQQVTSQKCG